MDDDTPTPEPAETPEADRRLLAELRAALGPDPVPAGLAGQCEELLTWADVDRELAALLEDDDRDVAGVRGSTAGVGQAMRFEVPGGTTVDVDVHADGLEGQIVPLGASGVVLERPDGSTASTEVDQLGRFSFTAVAPGTVRLRLEGLGRTVVTDWFVL